MADDVKPGEGEQKTKDAAGGEKPGKTDEVPFHDHPRWKEVYGQLKEFKELGLSPTDLKTRLQEGQELKAAFEEAARQAADEEGKKGGSEDEVKKVYKQAREELRKIFPEIDTIVEMRQEREVRNQRLERAALAETKKVLDSAGLETADKDVLAMTDILADIIKNDDDLLEAYYTNPRDAVRGAFKAYTAKVEAYVKREAAASKQRDAETRRGLPKAHGGGGGLPGEGEKPAPEAKSLAEAEKRAIERLRGSRE